MAETQIEYVYGINAVSEMLRHNPRAVQQLYLLDARKDKRIAAIVTLAESAGLSPQICDKQNFQAVLSRCFDKSTVNHQGVLAACKPSQARDEAYLGAMIKRAEHALLFLILDGVTDPHNLGACMRSADAAGVDAVIVPKDNAVGLTPVVRKVASGAAETLPLIVAKNLARCIGNLQTAGIWVFGAAGEAEQSLYDIDLVSHSAIVMGAEGSGLRRLTRERCDSLFKIPMSGAVESLNVSVAAGICVFEAQRQRSKR